MSHYLDLITIREDHRDRGDAFMRGEGMVEKSFPCWRNTARGKTVRSSIDAQPPEQVRRTLRELARPRTFPGANEGHEPSSVPLITTARL